MLLLTATLTVAALVSLAFLVLSRRDPEPEQPRRLESNLGVSAARRGGTESLFAPSDLQEIEQMLTHAAGEETTRSDERLLRVLEGLAAKKIVVTSVQDEDGAVVVRFGDGTDVVLQDPSTSGTETLRGLVATTTVTLGEISYDAPVLLVCFRGGDGTVAAVGASSATLR